MIDILDSHGSASSDRARGPRRNFSWMLVGTVVYAGCQWGMLVGLSKVSTPEVVGQFVLGLAVTAPIIMLGNLALRQIQATDVTNEYLFGDYLALRLVTSLVALLSVLVVVRMVGYLRENGLVILLVGVAKIIESMSDIVYGMFQRLERMDRVGTSLIIRGVVSLMAVTLGARLTGSLPVALLGLIVGWVCVFFLYDVKNGISLLESWSPAITEYQEAGVDSRSAFSPKWDFRILMKLAQFALPIGLAAMVISVIANMPRYFVEHYLGERDLGIFAAMTYVVVVGSLVVNALGQASSPRLAKHYSQGRTARFKALLVQLVVVSMVIGLAGVVLATIGGGEVLVILYRHEYAQSPKAFIVIMVAGLFINVASIFNYTLVALRAFRTQLIIDLVTAGGLFATLLYLVPKDGLVGAGLSLGLAAVLSMLLKGSSVWWFLAYRRQDQHG